MRAGEIAPGCFQADIRALPLEIAPGLWRLGNHHLAIFLVAGRERAALVEAGISCTTPAVLGQLAATGVAREKIGHLVLTHAHSDHATGQAGLLAALPAARLVLTAQSAAYLAKPAVAGKWEPEDRETGLTVVEREGGPGPETWGGILPLLPPDHLLVAAGDSLDLGGVTLRFLAGEGHAPGGLAVFVPELNALLASDSGGYLQGGKPGFPLYFVSYQTYMAELAALMELKAETVALGHQGWFTGAAAGRYLSDTRDFLETSHREILARLARGEEARAIGRDLFNRYHADELAIFPPPAIDYCCQLLVKRSRQAGALGDIQ